MSRKVWNKKKRGFTLIELIIVIAIIAILMALLIPNMMGYTAQAQKTVCDDNIAQIERAFQAKYALDPNVRVNDIIKNANGEYFTTTPTCPSGGTYRGANMYGTLYIECSYHGKSGGALDIAVNAYLNMDYLTGLTAEEFRKLTGNDKAFLSNDQFRDYLINNVYDDKSWPEFTDSEFLKRNGLTGEKYYIQPYVDMYGDAASGNIVVYVNQNGTNSPSGKWNANAIFNPEDGKWYTGKNYIQVVNKSWEAIKGEMQTNSWRVME